jgi:adenylate cyclase
METAQTDSTQTKPRSKSGSSTLRRRWWKGVAVGIVTGLFGGMLALTPLGNDFEKNVGLAWLFNMRGATTPPPEVVVVAINERASAKINLPALPRDWPRSIHGTLIDNLVKRGAAVIVFDVDFRRPKSDEQDLVFAKALARSNRTILVETLNGKRSPIFDANGKQTGTIWIEELLSPMEPLAKAARGLAPFPVPKVQVNVFQWTMPLPYL